jgi:hypothetical protein
VSTRASILAFLAPSAGLGGAPVLRLAGCAWWTEDVQSDIDLSSASSRCWLRGGPGRRADDRRSVFRRSCREPRPHPGRRRHFHERCVDEVLELALAEGSVPRVSRRELCASVTSEGRHSRRSVITSRPLVRPEGRATPCSTNLVPSSGRRPPRSRTRVKPRSRAPEIPLVQRSSASATCIPHTEYVESNSKQDVNRGDRR